jgi:hypothetical protein
MVSSYEGIKSYPKLDALLLYWKGIIRIERALIQTIRYQLTKLI